LERYVSTMFELSSATVFINISPVQGDFYAGHRRNPITVMAKR